MTRSTAAVPATNVALPAKATAPVPAGPRPTWVSGVTGGVGTRTVTRLLATQTPSPVTPINLGPEQHYCDVLVTATPAAATRWLPAALAHIDAPPVLVVVHTVPGSVPSSSRARIRAGRAHVTAVVHLPHLRSWLALDTPPDSGPLPRPAARARDELQRALEHTSTAPIGRNT